MAPHENPGSSYGLPGRKQSPPGETGSPTGVTGGATGGSNKFFLLVRKGFKCYESLYFCLLCVDVGFEVLDKGVELNFPVNVQVFE